MSSVLLQRDLVITLKKETLLNIGILSKLQPLPPELTRQIFKENALDKPTQNLFNHLSYYLVSIVDPAVCATLTWPLYDTKAERSYRNDFSSFISCYGSKGLLTPVMSSYLVNPGCYKVTVLIFQLSQLAVNRMLMTKLKKERQKKMYDDMTQKYKSQVKEGFIDFIENETEIMLSKFSNYQIKCRMMENIAELFRIKITEMEKKMKLWNPQKYIDDIVDKYITISDLDDATKSEVLKIKNVSEKSAIFDNWLTEADLIVDTLETEWNNNVSPFIDTCERVLENSQSLIARNTGELDRSMFTVKYNHATDEICTKDLENELNTEQKYILRNLVKDGKLNFPNLIRACVVCICFILKRNEVGDEIYKFNEYLEGGGRNYNEMVSAMRVLIDRMLDAEAKLQPSTEFCDQSVSFKDPEIPPLPDLSDLKMNKDLHCQVLFDTFTPLNMSKYQFNLRRRITNNFFAKPQPRSLLVTPFYQGPREDFLKSIISCHVSAYDRSNESQNINNMSMISQVTRANETIAECSAGFTKQQILRLLSTKKSSSSKKFKFKKERPNINVKKGGLFNESVASTESSGLFRSYSSPNLFENREKKSLGKGRGRKLSVMQENSPSLLEVSGIAALGGDSNYDSPLFSNNQNRCNVNANSSSNIPAILVTPTTEDRINNVLKNVEVDLNKEMGMDSIISPILEEPRKSIEVQDTKMETPKTNAQLIKKTSSLEKIINRFKKVRANVVSENNSESSEFKTIVEEKENLNFADFDVFSVNKVLLPDLLSPSCNTMPVKSNTNYLDDLCKDIDETVKRKPRESLGTALGVDQTFLDQFDLID